MAHGLHGVSALITGGAGLIGSHLADALVRAGAARVIVLDTFERGRIENLEAALASGRVQVVEGDIRDRRLTERLTAGIDLVFHQAALRITQCAREPLRAVQVLVDGTQSVLDAAVKHRVGKVLAASSASVYGEPSYLPVDEAHPFNNRTLYGAGKVATEQMLRAYAEMYGLSYVALRPFNVYGPRMDTHGAYTEVMVRWLERLSAGEPPVIYGDGAQVLDFTYVEDVVEAYLLAATAPVTDAVVNAGSGTATSLLELCRLLTEVMGRPDLAPVFAPPRAVNPVTRRQADTRLARELLGFEARTPLALGVRRLAQWYAATHDHALVGAA